MSEYHKIQSVYKRDPKSHRFTNEFSIPEFEYLQDLQWEWTEKIDGTNTRIYWNAENQSVLVGGRTNNAQMPTQLVQKIQEILNKETFADRLPDLRECVLYGEGYGAKIQNGGGYIPNGVGFILFDVWCGMWLRRADVEDIAQKIQIPVAPIIGRGSIAEAQSLCEKGFPSLLRSEPPEGLVLRPKVELRTRRGDRIITKLKLKDFR